MGCYRAVHAERVLATARAALAMRVAQAAMLEKELGETCAIAHKAQDALATVREQTREESEHFRRQIGYLSAEQHSSSQPAQEPTEIARLRAGLQWYADHHHYDLEGWEDCSGESANWLFPPTEHSWMVDNGGIARAILDGHEINPDPDADEVTRRPVAAERAT